MKCLLEGPLVYPDKILRQQVLFDSYTHNIEMIGISLGQVKHYFDDNTLLFPGFIDIHVHARDDAQGTQSYKEDFQSVSLAAQNGAVAAIMDMPNNTIPPTDEESYTKKQNVISKKASIPIISYAGIGPQTLPLQRKVPYKVYMGPSVGTLFFSNLVQLKERLELYRGKHVSFHCEDPDILQKNTTQFDHAHRRPPEAEISAVEKAIKFIKEFDLEGILCHISTKEAISLIRQAKKEGIKVKYEVSFHHLLLDETISDSQINQVNPPIRSKSDRLSLIEALGNNEVDFLATDHAPHTEEEKRQNHSGLTHLDTYALCVAKLIKEYGISPNIIAQCASFNPGEFWNQFSPIKMGQIKTGYAPRFSIIDFSKSTVVTKDFLKTKVRHSPFEDWQFPAKGFLL